MKKILQGAVIMLAAGMVVSMTVPAEIRAEEKSSLSKEQLYEYYMEAKDKLKSGDYSNEDIKSAIDEINKKMDISLPDIKKEDVDSVINKMEEIGFTKDDMEDTLDRFYDSIRDNPHIDYEDAVESFVKEAKKKVTEKLLNTDKLSLTKGKDGQNSQVVIPEPVKKGIKGFLSQYLKELKLQASKLWNGFSSKVVG